MFLSEEIQAALNVSAITSLLGTYNSLPALFHDTLIPQDCTTLKTINFYMSTPFDGGLNYETANYSINCREINSNKSITMAKAVFDEINRMSYSDYFIVCSVLQTIPPADTTDVYNTPVEVVIKKR